MPNHPKPSIHITIAVDGREYHIDRDQLTGAELRAVITPPIGADFSLYLEIHGSGDDRLIQDTETVPLKSGMHFFSAPSTIAPGLAA